MRDTNERADATRARAHPAQDQSPSTPMYAPLDAAWDVGHRAFDGPHAGKGPRGYRRSDQRIHEDVNDALTAHPHLDASDVVVHCEDGVVTLTGQVPSRRCKRTAEDIAHAQAGVHDVNNQLRTTHRRAAIDDSGIDEVAALGMAPVNDGPRY